MSTNVNSVEVVKGMELPIHQKGSGMFYLLGVNDNDGNAERMLPTAIVNDGDNEALAVTNGAITIEDDNGVMRAIYTVKDDFAVSDIKLNIKPQEVPTCKEFMALVKAKSNNLNITDRTSGLRRRVVIAGDKNIVAGNLFVVNFKVTDDYVIAIISAVIL